MITYAMVGFLHVKSDLAVARRDTAQNAWMALIRALRRTTYLSFTGMIVNRSVREGSDVRHSALRFVNIPQAIGMIAAFPKLNRGGPTVSGLTLIAGAVSVHRSRGFLFLPGCAIL